MLNAQRLRNLRKEKGLKQLDIANILNIQRTTYVKYETSDIQPPNDILVKIAEIFDVSTDYLLGSSNHPFPANKIKQNEKEKESENMKSEDLEKPVTQAQFKRLEDNMNKILALLENRHDTEFHHEKGV